MSQASNMISLLNWNKNSIQKRPKNCQRPVEFIINGFSQSVFFSQMCIYLTFISIILVNSNIKIHSYFELSSLYRKKAKYIYCGENIVFFSLWYVYTSTAGQLTFFLLYKCHKSLLLFKCQTSLNSEPTQKLSEAFTNVIKLFFSFATGL